jgi:hypothetical protein
MNAARKPSLNEHVPMIRARQAECVAIVVTALVPGETPEQDIVIEMQRLVPLIALTGDFECFGQNCLENVNRVVKDLVRERSTS